MLFPTRESGEVAPNVVEVRPHRKQQKVLPVASQKRGDVAEGRGLVLHPVEAEEGVDSLETAVLLHETRHVRFGDVEHVVGDARVRGVLSRVRDHLGRNVDGDDAGPSLETFEQDVSREVAAGAADVQAPGSLVRRLLESAPELRQGANVVPSLKSVRRSVQARWDRREVVAAWRGPWGATRGRANAIAHAAPMFNF